MKKDYRRKYINLKREYRNFYKTIEVTKLKPATGDLRKYQIELLEFIKKILSKLDNESIRYFLIGGSLVGALRHKGYIPWDDDMDLGMMREDYDKLYDFCKKNYIEIPQEKVCLKRYDMERVYNRYLHKYPNQILFCKTPYDIQIIYGENILTALIFDFFPFDFYSKNITIEEYSEYIKAVKEKRNSLNNFKKIFEYFDKERSTNPIFKKDSNRIYCALEHIDNYDFPHKGFFELETLFPLKKAKFEDCELPIPNKADEYLNLFYPNYMKMPEDIKLSFHNKLRKNALLKSFSIFYLIKKQVFSFISLICKISINNKYTEEKEFILDLIKESIFKSRFDYKKGYESILKNYEFLKSIV